MNSAARRLYASAETGRNGVPRLGAIGLAFCSMERVNPKFHDRSPVVATPIDVKSHDVWIEIHTTRLQSVSP
jgi:hypothetical protein